MPYSAFRLYRGSQDFRYVTRALNIQCRAYRVRFLLRYAYHLDFDNGATGSVPEGSTLEIFDSEAKLHRRSPREENEVLQRSPLFDHGRVRFCKVLEILLGLLGLLLVRHVRTR